MGAPFWTPTFDIENRADGTVLMRARGAVPTPARSLPHALAHWAEARPDQTFVAQREKTPGGTGDWIRVTYAEAFARAQEIGAALLALGLGPDRPVMVLSGNSIDHALLGLACQIVGVPYAPLSTAYSLVSTDHAKIKDIYGLLKPGLVFAEEGAPFGAALAALAALPGDHRVLTSAPDTLAATHPGALDFATFGTGADTAPARAAMEALTPESVAKYLFTSGSTGSPKAVINTQGMLCANQAMVAHVYAFVTERPPVVVDWAPWNHTASGNKVFNMVLVNGGTFYIDEGKPSPAGMAETIRNLHEIAPTWYFNVPAGYEALIRAMDADPALRDRFFSRLDMMLYAGAGMAQHTWDDLLRLSREALGREVLLTSALGATETGPFAFTCTEQQRTAGNIGVPVIGVTLKLVPNGGKLEARIKSPSITPGYYGAPEVTAGMRDEEGFYLLGDALRPADPDDLTKGFFFDGRTAENFKLSTGTWVAVGALRAALVNGFEGLLRDVVITGEGQDFLGAIGIADPAIMASLTGGSADDLPALAAHPAVVARLQDCLNAYAAAATGSASRVKRLVVLADALDLDKGEMTDKGSINQRAVLANRADLVAVIYAGGAGVISAA